jgi:hypothetical protein
MSERHSPDHPAVRPVDYDEPTLCECPQPTPDVIGECGHCHRLVWP